MSTFLSADLVCEGAGDFKTACFFIPFWVG
jgi:hypothetical protein